MNKMILIGIIIGMLLMVGGDGISSQEASIRHEECMVNNGWTKVGENSYSRKFDVGTTTSCL